MSAAPLPVVVFDGDCGFCRRCVLWLRARTGERVDYRPYQEVHAQFPQVEPAAFARAVHLIDTDGRASSGATAVARVLRFAPGWGWAPLVHRFVPGAAWISERAYRIVADHRVGFSRLARWFSGPQLEPPSFQLSRRLFFGLLGVVFLAAFVSCWLQIHGLAGSDGLLPVEALLEQARNTLGAQAWWRLPTLCWWNSSDACLDALCGVGTLGSLLMIAGRAPRALALLLWLLYLSLVVAGQDFFEFQWDGLLLETALLAVLFAPRGWRAQWRVEPTPGGMFLMRWLLFRLLLLSGIAKLASGDPAWSRLQALDFHFWTQPLPLSTSFAVHQAPGDLHAAGVVLVLAIEIGMPLLIFGARRLRLIAAAGIVMLQIAIALTGSYGFFNVLTIALCLLLVDDRSLRALVPRFLRDRLLPLRPAVFVPGSLGRRAAGALAGGALFVLATFAALESLSRDSLLPSALQPVWRQVRVWRSTNAYGLFATMTRERPELVLEGSVDGSDWREYEFTWKPGRLDRAPRPAGLHMPRLDWQMWFEALGRSAGWPPSAWFVALQERLLAGSPAVQDLLAADPFAGRRPRHVRAVLYVYQFTSEHERRRTGRWWRRERRETFAAVSGDGR